MINAKFTPHPSPLFMTTGEFEKTNWRWQLEQFQQQVGEWIALQLSRFQSTLPNLPEWSLPKWSLDLIRAIALLISGLLLIWLGWQLWRLLEFYLYAFSSKTGKLAGTTTKSSISLEAWLKRSQIYFSQGNYREACRCLYMAMLQRLHERGIVHQPSRTDGEYLQLVQQLPQSGSYQTLIAIHQQLCFDNTEILPETFAQCQQAYREIAGE